MKYHVDAPFRVEFLDPDDMTGRGIRTIRERCVGVLEAESDDMAVRAAEDAIRARYPVCWQLIIGDITIEEEAA